MERVEKLGAECNLVGTTSSAILGDDGLKGLKGVSNEKKRYSTGVEMKGDQRSAEAEKPIRNCVMKGVSACMTGFYEKSVLIELTKLIKSMGGSSGPDMDLNVTHLICNRVGGSKYKYAKIFGLPVLRSEWVFDAWKRRDEMDFSATCENFLWKHKLLPFEGRKICFFGFQNDTLRRMEDILKRNGGVSTGLEDEKCFHVIVPNDSIDGTVSSATVINKSSAQPSAINAKTSIQKVLSCSEAKRCAEYSSESFGNISVIEYEDTFAAQKTEDDNLTEFNNKSSSRKRKNNSPTCTVLETDSSSKPCFKTPFLKVCEYQPKRKCKQDTPRPSRNLFLNITYINSTSVTSSIDDDNETVLLSDFSTSSPVSKSDRPFSSLFVGKHGEKLSEFIQLKPNGIILKADWFWHSIESGFVDNQEYLVGLTDTHQLNVIYDSPKTSPMSSTRSQLTSEHSLYGTMSASSLESSKQSMRYKYFMEFLDTESNYVGVLDEIVNHIKTELDELAGTNSALLSHGKIRDIFQNFLPLFEVHERLLDHLNALNNDWNDECRISDIIIELKSDLMQAYIPYLNNFENMKTVLMQCAAKKNRFRRFLNISQGRPRCRGHHLKDIMIFPIQRLPRIELLLKEIWKHTSICNPDHVRLKEAIQTMQQILNDINYDKRRMETLHEVFNSIEDCPLIVLNNHRRLVLRCQVKELSHCLADRGTTLVLFTFSDLILVCKRQSHTFSAHTLKYTQQILLKDIRWIINITDNKNAFALLLLDYKIYSFAIFDERFDKTNYLIALTETYAKHMERTDKNAFFQQRKLRDLNLKIDSDANTSKLKKLRNSFYSKFDKTL